MNIYQEALNDVINNAKDWNVKNDSFWLLQELVIKQSVFQELYDEYVINEKGDTLTEGAKQLAYVLKNIHESMELVIEINRLK